MKSGRVNTVAFNCWHGGHQLAPQYRNTGRFCALAEAKACSTLPENQAMRGIHRRRRYGICRGRSGGLATDSSHKRQQRYESDASLVHGFELSGLKRGRSRPLAKFAPPASMAVPSPEKPHMKLYFAPGTCALAAHIALIEAGV